MKVDWMLKDKARQEVQRESSPVVVANSREKCCIPATLGPKRHRSYPFVDTQSYRLRATNEERRRFEEKRVVGCRFDTAHEEPGCPVSSLFLGNAITESAPWDKDRLINPHGLKRLRYAAISIRLAFQHR